MAEWGVGAMNRYDMAPGCALSVNEAQREGD